MSLVRAAVLLAVFLSGAFQNVARASGVDVAPGQTGVAQLLEPEEPKLRSWRVGLTAGAFWSALVFDDGVTAQIQQTHLAAFIEYVPLKRVTFQLVVGSSVAGTLADRIHVYALLPGWVGGGSASYAVLEGKGYAPFILLDVTVVASSGVTAEDDGPHSFHGLDARFGLAVGKTFWDIFSPYLEVRGFLGNATWDRNDKNASGTDAYHYQAGLGANVRVWKGLDLYAEGSPLGERKLTGGAAYTF